MVYAGTFNLLAQSLGPLTDLPPLLVSVATARLVLQTVPADAHPVPSGRRTAPIPVSLVPCARSAVLTAHPFTEFR